MLWNLFTTTPIYNSPVLRLPQSGIFGEMEVPLHLTKMSAPNNSSQVIEVSAGGIMDWSPTTGFNSNMVSGGMALGYGAAQLDKIQLEGFLDTPFHIVGSTYPGLFYPGQVYPNQGTTGQFVGSTLIIGFRSITYGEILAAYFEGRTVSPTGRWSLVLPKWYRDPYGRVFTSPRMYDLTVQQVAGAPFRQNFTMTLQVS